VKELNNPLPKEPFFFLKPTSSYLSSGKLEIPRGILAHHEGKYALLQVQLWISLMLNSNAVELGLVIGKSGRDISQANAHDHITGYSEPSVPA
jgi:acylpyruvate hydrolase